MALQQHDCWGWRCESNTYERPSGRSESGDRELVVIEETRRSELRFDSSTPDAIAIAGDVSAIGAGGNGNLSLHETLLDPVDEADDAKIGNVDDLEGATREELRGATTSLVLLEVLIKMASRRPLDKCTLLRDRQKMRLLRWLDDRLSLSKIRTIKLKSIIWLSARCECMHRL